MVVALQASRYEWFISLHATFYKHSLQKLIKSPAVEHKIDIVDYENLPVTIHYKLLS